MIQSSSSSRKSTTVRSNTSIRIARAALQTAYLLSDELGAGFAERLFISPRRHRRPDRERELLARGRRFTAPIMLRSPRGAGTRLDLAAWRWGIGPTVLLVHGWEGRGAQLGEVIRPLVAAGLSVVTFDAPGHGDSPGRRLYLTDLADAIADVASTVGPLHAIVAHSFGAAAVLLAHSRGGVDAAHNVMIAPSVLIGEAVDSFARIVGLDDRDRGGFVAAIARHSGVSVDALEIERLAAPRDAGLLVIHDRDDAEVGLVHGERLAAAWPNARLVVTEGLGHRRILRDPEVIRQTVGAVRQGVAPPASDLVREVDRLVDALEAPRP